MTAPAAYPWPCYADLQERGRKHRRIDGYAWGLERAQHFLLNAIAAGTVPAHPAELEVALKRVIASEARRHRSQTAARVKLTPVQESPGSDSPAAEARIELARIAQLVSVNDENILSDVGLGYADREIALRRDLTAGGVRVRLSRVRVRLAA
jgi:DNA-binding NarL/FixJ family response regulator